MRNFRILHAPFDMAGQAWGLNKSLKNLGYKSDLLVYAKNKYGYGFDFFIDIRGYNTRLGQLFLIPKILPFIKNYDIFHFHVGKSFLHHQRDLLILKFLRKKIVVHFWGSEARQLDTARKYKYHYSHEIEIDVEKEEEKRRRIAIWQKYADLLIVGDYELQEYVPGSEVLPQTYDIESISKIKLLSSHKSKIKIIHAPTRTNIKGTKYVLSAVEKIKKEYGKQYKIEFILVENIKHLEALRLFGESDLIIDQLLMGSYGILSIEAMALGKPVLCYIRDDLIKNYPNLPILNTNPDNLYKNLKLLIEDEDLRKKLGVQGVKYVKNRHDPVKIAKKLTSLYKGLYK